MLVKVGTQLMLSIPLGQTLWTHQRSGVMAGAVLGQWKATEQAVEDEKWAETTNNKDEAGRGGVLPHLMKSLELFHFNCLYFLVAFLSWNSVITLILKFKSMDFYLCISILVWVSVMYECTWGNLARVTRCTRWSGAHVAVEFEKNGAHQECRWMLVVVPPIECPLACVMSVSNLWNLAQYELKQKK